MFYELISWILHWIILRSIFCPWIFEMSFLSFCCIFFIDLIWFFVSPYSPQPPARISMNNSCVDSEFAKGFWDLFLAFSPLPPQVHCSVLSLWATAIVFHSHCPTPFRNFWELTLPCSTKLPGSDHIPRFRPLLGNLAETRPFTLS